MFGIYIDDLLTVLRVGRRIARLPNADSDFMDRADLAYKAEGLPRSVEKGFEKDLDFKAWGFEMRVA